MKKESANLAIVSNNTFEASKAVNLHHYDISSALQTTLEFDELIHIFSNKIQKLIPHSGFIYENEEFSLEIKNGIATNHYCNYALKVEEMELGVLKVMRRQRFDEKEMKLLETLLCSLIYPLRNATLFNQALKMAYTDPLTKTNNRAAFNDSLRREIKRANRNSSHLSIIFVDLDHFKDINDNYGHDCGDLVLASSANCIKNIARGSDIVYRFGGEEFIILLSDTSIDGAKIMAERIRQSLESHTVAYGMDIIKLTASLGISALKGKDTGESLLKRADHAMYQAKEKGRNRVQIETLIAV